MLNPINKVDFFFDPMCPWAYQTSLWIREVRRLTGLEINWRFFSLEEVNRPEGKPHPWERPLAYGWSPLRVAARLRRRDMALCDAWYAACGKALHTDGRKPHNPEVAKELLESIGASGDDWDLALAEPSLGLYDTAVPTPEVWGQFLNGQAPAVQGLMSNYLEQSKSMFAQMQDQMSKQAETLFPGMPGFMPPKR